VRPNAERRRTRGKLDQAFADGFIHSSRSRNEVGPWNA
jgi:hypothetical protein